MRVLSRRRKFAQGRSVRVFRVCGFSCSNGTLLAPSPRSSPWRRVHLSDGVRGPPLGVYLGVPGAAGSRLWPCPPAERPSALRRGWGDSSTASARCTRGAATVHSAVSPLQLGPSRPPSATAEARCDGVGRRPKTPPDDQDERSPAPATAAPTCGFSHIARG